MPSEPIESLEPEDAAPRKAPPLPQVKSRKPTYVKSNPQSPLSEEPNEMQELRIKQEEEEKRIHEEDEEKRRKEEEEEQRIQKEEEDRLQRLIEE